MTGMNINDFRTGQVVISRKGKDTGTWYLVVEADRKENRVLVTDGKRNLPVLPKRKNPLHLQVVKKIHTSVPVSLEKKISLSGDRIRQLLEEERRIRYQNKEVD
jgi:ribosomal protein L14E/L6E/L27E